MAAAAGTLVYWNVIGGWLPLVLYILAISRAGWRAGARASILVGTAGIVTLAIHRALPTSSAGLSAAVPLFVSTVYWLFAVSDARASDAIHQGERQYRLMVENIHDHAMFMTDTEGRVTKWNAGAARLLGWDEDQILGQPGAVIFTPEDREREVPAKEMATALQEGHAADERWHQRRDGSRFYAAGMMMRADDNVGRHLGFTKVLRNMTERLRADQEISVARALAVTAAESERNRLAEVFNRSPSFMAVMRGPQHIFELSNDRHFELVGRRDILNKPVREALPELVGQGIFELLDRVFATGEPFVAADVRIELQRQASGPPDERYVDLVYQATRNADGSVSGVFVHGVDLTDRRHAEEALRASEVRHAAAVAAALDCIISMDQQGVVTEWNPAAERTFSLSREEAVGCDLASLIIPPALREAHRKGLARYLATGEGPVLGKRFEINAVRQDGAEFPVELSITRLPSTGPAMFVGYLRDITEAKRAEQQVVTARQELEKRVVQRTRELAEANAALRLEREFLSAVLEHAVDGIVACDADGTLRLFNRASREFHGLPQQPLPPEQWADHYDLFEADGTTRMSKARVPLFRALTEGVVNDQEMVIAPKGQSPRLLVANGRAITDGEGRKLGAVVVMHDLTAGRLAEAQRDRAIREEAARREAEMSAMRLRESEERLRLAVLIAQMGTFDIDLRTDAVTVNDAGREVYGWSPGEPLTFAKVQSHFHADDRAEVLRRVADAFLPEGPGEFEVEQRIVRENGVIRWIRVRGRAIFEAVDDRHEASRCVGTYLDITEQKEAEERREQLFVRERQARTEAERAGRMKDEFLATLSHELRTPLNAILGWSQILINTPHVPSDLTDGLRTIERNARAQAQIIEDLLDMSRIISGRVRLEVQQVDLAALMREAVETSMPAADAKSIRISAVLDPSAGPVAGDSARLQQVMWNLLSNAVKFTPKGGRIQVLLQRVNSHVEASIIDTGEGIRPEFLAHVFDRFRQADATTTRRHGGLGLGLSIVKQLVELHGGSVRVASAGEGQGSTFIVVLPLHVIHPDPHPEAVRRHPKAGGSATNLTAYRCQELTGVKVLVVDDEPDARALVRRVLEDCNAIVSIAASAAEVMDILQTERPDVLVSDIGMPVQDGYDLIRQVRALREDQGGKVPALALTAYARAEDRMQAIRAGFQMHVAKPIEPAELITMVASLSGRA